jgi:hypothetical protein
MTAELSRRFSTERTSLGEPIHVIGLDRSEGVVERGEAFLESSRELIIKEYFFGDARRSLSPQIQQADFDGLVIYRASDCESPLSTHYRLLAVQICELNRPECLPRLLIWAS